MGEDWVVDSLLGFLQSPIWRQPVNSFIEEKCVVFDIGDESSFSQTEVHLEYKAIVEKLLEEFLAYMEITPEQLAEVFSQTTSLIERHHAYEVFNQILAAEDFIMFKSMMVQKNIDLELKALTILQKQLGHSPEAYVKEESETKTLPTHDHDTGEDEKILKEVLEISKKEYDLEQSLNEEQLEKLVTLAKQESVRLYQAAEKEQKLLTESIDKMCLKAQSVSGDDESSTTSSSISSMKVELSESVGKVTESLSPPTSCELSNLPNITSPLKTSQQEPLQPLVQQSQAVKNEGSSSSDAATEWLKSAKAEFGHPSMSSATPKGTKVAVEIPDDLKTREQYLRQQRDRLLEMKRKARAKELDSYTATRPKSGRVVATHSTVQDAGHCQRKEQREESSAERKKEVVKSQNEQQQRSKGMNTGILCSAIAGKMRKEHV